MAVLLTLRRRLIDEHGATTAAELMLIDSVVLAYYYQMRANGWVGDLAQWLESEFFRKESLTAKFRDEYGRSNGRIRGLKVEDIVERLVEKIMPLLDRSNRLLLRNLKALRDQTRSAVPQVSIGTAEQVNVAQAQVNTSRPD
jgi:nucleoid DNA-binding protein